VVYNWFMNTQDLLKQEREIWGDKKQTLEHIAICMGKPYGDICEQARSKIETGKFDEVELKKELGNTVASTIRFIDDLGYDVEECINLALDSQRAYKRL